MFSELGQHDAGSANSGHILVIDDDPDSVEITRQFLEWAGIEVQTAVNARDGIALATSDPPAAIFLDLNMPSISGVDALRILRSHEATREIAVAAVTGVPEMLDTIEDIKFDWVLTKPVPSEQLVRVARALIATANVKPESSEAT